MVGCKIRWWWVFTRGSGWQVSGVIKWGLPIRSFVKSGSKDQQQVLAWHNQHLQAALTAITATLVSAYRTQYLQTRRHSSEFSVSWLSVNSTSVQRRYANGEARKGGRWRQLQDADSQFDGFVPHNNVAWEGEGLHVDDVDVSSFCADVQPFALEGQVAVCDSERDQDASPPGFSLSHDSGPLKGPNHAGPAERSSEWVGFNYRGRALWHTNEAGLFIVQWRGKAGKYCCLFSSGLKLHVTFTFTEWNLTKNSSASLSFWYSTGMFSL